MHPSAARWIGALIRMTSSHPAMTQILDVVERLQSLQDDHSGAAAAPHAAGFRTNALLLGEPGTGKEGLARALHHLMAPGTPLVRLDLVGHSDGEALEVLRGAAADAGGGMLLVEEIAGLSLRLQTALLRLLKGGRWEGPAAQRRPAKRPARSLRPSRINAIAMSDRDLSAEVDAGRFRHDLYFALARIVLTLPPLRERAQDIGPASVWIGNRILRAAGRGLELMASEEFAHARRDEHAAAIELQPGAITALERYAWPGNFRELEAVLERALMLHRTGPSIGRREIEAALGP